MGMKHAFILSVLLATSPVAVRAQDENRDMTRGAEMLRQGMGLMLEGLLNEMRPTAEDLADGWVEGWGKLVEMLNDFSAYEAPVFLPNGDILIRRKEPLVPDVAPKDGPEDVPEDGPEDAPQAAPGSDGEVDL